MSKSDSPSPNLSFEKTAWKKGYSCVAGLDEAGRGPWAGPVVAAAVILDKSAIPAGLNDSKRLKEEQRERLFEELSKCARIGVGIADAKRIDRDNILAASMWAMTEAARGIPQYPDFALIDGNRLPELSCPAEAIVKGDGRSLSIAAASIVAKVTRDRMLYKLEERYPGYGFAQHKGYGTARHRKALAKLGPCPAHRKSFAPIRALLGTQAAYSGSHSI